jgi:hypothetical protein
MSKSLQTFLNRIQKNGIRTQNQFELDIFSGYSEVDKVLEDVTLYAEGAALPTRTITYGDVPFKAYPFKIPTNMTMGQEHSLTIKCDLNGDIRKAFLKWQSYMIDGAISNGSFLGGDRRIPANSFVRMHLLGADMEKIIETYKLIGVGVSEVGELTLSNADATVATFSVGLVSQYWELETNNSGFQGLK